MLEAAAIVLAGGKSTRMGENKALLTVNEQKMIEAVIRELNKVFPEIIISANGNDFDDLGVRSVQDVFTGHGPLGGIHAGLEASSYYVNFVVACDMPFIDIRLAVYMINSSAGYDALVPKLGEYYQPLYAVYTKGCIAAIERQLKCGQNKIISFYPEVKTMFIETREIKRYGDPERIFFNVNTPGDLELVKSMLSNHREGK